MEREVVTVLSGSGCLGHGTQVLLYDGTIRAAEQLAVGDALMGMDSTRRRISAIHRERGALYQVIPSHGPSWLCGDKHVMTLTGCSYQRGLTINVPVAELSKWTSLQRSYWRLWRRAVDFPTAWQRMDPYFIGLWLGDGSRDRPEITSMDHEVIAYCKQAALRYGLRRVVANTPSRAKIIRLVGPHGGDLSTRKNIVHDAVRGCVKDGQKYIPLEYLIADRAQRFSLLAGLLDTDGCLDRHHFALSTSIASFSDSILFLARSLGLAAYVTQRQSSIKSTGFVGTYWHIHISGDLTELPTRIARKRWTPHPRARRTNSPGFSLSPVGDGLFYSFALDGEGGFYLGDFTVSGPLPRGMCESSQRARNSVSMHQVVWEETKKEASKRGLSLAALVETALSALLSRDLVGESHEATLWPVIPQLSDPNCKLVAMAKKQTRRSVSLNRSVYEAVTREAEQRGMSLAGFVEFALGSVGVPIADHPRQTRDQVLAHPSRAANRTTAEPPVADAYGF